MYHHQYHNDIFQYNIQREKDGNKYIYIGNSQGSKKYLVKYISMGDYPKRTRSYRRRNKKTNKYLTKRKRKSIRRTRKQKAGNANLINATAAAAASLAALGAGVYYMGNRRYENKRAREAKAQREKPYGPPDMAQYIKSPFKGNKSGYVFKNGKLGIGYYKDNKKVSKMTGTCCDGRSDDYRYIKDTGSVSTLNYLVKDGFDHKIYEQGGGGDCFYCCYAAALNDNYRKQGDKTRVSMKQLRDDVANKISQIQDENKLRMLYFKEYDDHDSWRIDIKHIKRTLINRTRDTEYSNRRYATDYDMLVLSQKYNVGVIIFSVNDGNVVCFGSSKSYPHYALILWDTTMRFKDNKDSKNHNIDYDKLEIDDLNHYRSIGIRKSNPSRDEPYEFLIKCNELPDFIKNKAKTDCRSNMNTDCP